MTQRRSSNRKLNRSSLLMLAVLLMCLSLQLMAVTVKVNRNVIGMNESLVLTYQASSGWRGNPGFSIISRDFNIVSNYQKFSFSLINGRPQTSTVYTLVLRPTRVGLFVIPKIRFGREYSAKVVVRVINKPGQKQPSTVSGVAPYYSELSIEPKNPWVQQEVDMVLRIYTARNLSVRRSRIRVGKVEVSSGDALVRTVSRGRSYEKEVSGQSYVVYEYRYKLYPQRSGVIEIPVIKSRLLIYRRYSRYYRYPSGASGLKYVRTKAHKITVKPRPASYGKGRWLPALKLNLSDAWSGNPQQLYVGDSITRTLMIEALGLTAEQLPAIKSVMPSGLKAYSEKAILRNIRDVDHVRGTRKVKILFIPTRAGTYTIPEIRLHWWNVKTNTLEIAKLPARIVNVLPKPGQTTGSSIIKPPLTGSNPNSSDSSLSPTKKSPVTIVVGYSVVWIWLTVIFAIAWISTMLLWLTSAVKKCPSIIHDNEREGGKTSYPEHSAVLNSEQGLRKLIRQSCERGAPEACHKALLDWAKLHWQKNFPTSVSQIAERLQDKAFVNEVDRMNKVLFANAQKDTTFENTSIRTWDGNSLWEAFSAAIQQSHAHLKEESSPLASLYPDK